ncbi:MAG: gliding motility-associated C-terminal domain-containing protein, partial [Luteibaculum sp.]
ELNAADDGGTWSGAGIVDQNSGRFDPSVAGPGSHSIIHRFDGFCPDADTTVIVVKQRRNAAFQVPAIICSEDEPLTLVPQEQGGIWSGTGVSGNQFNPKTAGVGFHTIRYSINGDCGATETRSIEVVKEHDATILGPEVACILESPVSMQIRDNGGIWTGQGVSASGVFDPKEAGIGIHQLIYRFDGRCPSADTIDIKVTDKLNASIDSVEVLCNDFSPINLNAVDPGGTWSGTGITNANTGVFTPSAANIGLNQVRYLIGGLCGDTAYAYIQVAEREDARILHNTLAYCFEAEADTLDATPGGTWSGLGISDQGIFKQNSLAPGSYQIFYEIDSICPDKDSIALEVYQPHSFEVLEAQDPSCFGDCNGQVNSIASGGSNQGFNYSLNGQNTQGSGFFNGLCPGNYQISITDNLGCAGDSSFILVEPDSLYAQIRVENEKCFKLNGGAEIDTIIGGTAPFTVRWSDNKTGESNFTFAEGNYNYILTDANGCFYTDSFEVGFIEGPKIFFQTDSVSCFGFSDGAAAIDSISGGIAPYEISWSTGSADSTVSALSAGTYQVEVKDQEACIGKASLSIFEPTSVELQLPDNQIFCDGQSYTLKPAALGGNGAPYQFHFPELQLQQDSLYADSSLRISLYALDPKACSSDTLEFVFTELPPLQVQILSDTTVCRNVEVVFSTQTSGGKSADYQLNWSNGQRGPSASYLFENEDEDQFIHVRLEDNCSTPTQDSVLVRFHPRVRAGFLLNPNPAEGCEPLEISYQDTSFNSVQQQYFLDGRELLENPFEVNAGKYDFMQVVSSQEFCVDTLLIQDAIHAFPLPQFSLHHLPEDATELSDYYEFFSRSTVPLGQFDWRIIKRGGDTVITSATSSPEYFGELEPGRYDVELYAQSAEGCPGEAFYFFDVREETRLFIPNAFSPNGNGTNDVFKLEGINLEREKISLSIFNRWGEQIFQTDDPLNEPWDGIDERTGRPVPPMVYEWLI